MPLTSEEHYAICDVCQREGFTPGFNREAYKRAMAEYFGEDSDSASDHTHKPDTISQPSEHQQSGYNAPR